MEFSSEHERMIWLFSKGYSLSSVADIVDVHRETVRRCMISFGIDTGYHNRKSLEARPYARMVSEMRLSGIPWRDISAKLGFSERTLRRYSAL